MTLISLAADGIGILGRAASAASIYLMPDGQSLETLTAADFRAITGTRFLLTGTSNTSGPSGPFEIELVEVGEHASGSRDGYRAPFSLLFHGPLTPVMPQAIYRVEHERLGAFGLFVVPVGPTPGGAMRYEVVFG